MSDLIESGFGLAFAVIGAIIVSVYAPAAHSTDHLIGVIVFCLGTVSCIASGVRYCLGHHWR